jgi:hypothetical protein
MDRVQRQLGAQINGTLNGHVLNLDFGQNQNGVAHIVLERPMRQLLSSGYAHPDGRVHEHPPVAANDVQRRQEAR